MSSSAGSSNFVDFDEYVDLKLQKTRSTIKSTDLLVALAGVAAMFLGYLLVFVVLDQWVVPGGFGIGLRWTLLSTLLLSTAAWLGWKVGLPYLRTVNRLYAAREIEKADSDLKSNLLNLVDLRESGRNIDPTILRTLEKRAAVQLQNIDVTQAIDHRPLMQSAYVLLGVVVLFCVYALISPKKISTSIWRSLLPSAQVDVATRTEILSVDPGDTTVFARTQIPVAADIAGEIPEKVWLYFSTADGKFRDEPVELTAGGGQTQFKGRLLGENGQGLLQDLTYVVKAGDAVSREYHITVNQPPQATADRIRFEFPSYMKLDPVEQAGGQIDSWEGTKVTLHARTNIPVKTADVQFLREPNGMPTGEDIPMVVTENGQSLSLTWTLNFDSDGNYSKFYQIQCKTESDAADPKPIVYTLAIRPDQRPEVAFLDPVRDLEVPANATVPLLIEARDPDFELSHVNLHIKKNGQPVHKELLSQGRQQRVLVKHDLKLEDRMVLKPGDLVELWVEAFDNKQPRANRKSTPELKLTIVEPITPQEAKQKLAEDQSNRDQRLQEAEKDQNADGRADQKPMNGGDDERRPQPDPNQKPPANQDQLKQDPNKNDQNQGDPGTNGKAGESKNGQGQQQGGQKADGSKGGEKSQEGGKEGADQQPLNPNGDDDQKALERLYEQLNKPGKKPTDSPKDSSDPQNSQGNRSNSTDKPKSDAGQSGDKSDPDSNQGQTPNAQDPKKDPSAKPGKPSKPDAGKNDASSPMPNPNGDGDNSAKPEKSGSDSAKPSDDKQNPDHGSPPDSTGKKPSPEKNKKPGNSSDPQTPPQGDSQGNGQDSKSDSTDPSNSSDKPKPEKSGQEKSGQEKPDQKMPTGDSDKKQESGSGDGQPSNEPGPKGTESPKQDANPSQQGSGSKSQSKPGKGGDENSKPGDADGPRESAKESPDAKKELATGDETGTAKADKDSDAEAVKSKNPNELKRDPNDKPTRRPGDPKAESPSKSTDPALNEAKDPKQQAGPDKQPIEQQPTEPGKGSDPKQTEKRGGDPNAADEPKKGEGAKDQRSNQGSGGEGGSSKEDKEGNSGAQNSGEGDASSRAGNEPGKKTDKTGQKSEPGSGKKTAEGTGEKKDGSDGTNSSDQDPSNKSDPDKTAPGKKDPDKGPGQQEGAKPENSDKQDATKPRGKQKEGKQAGQKQEGGKSDGQGQKGKSGQAGEAQDPSKSQDGEPGKDGRMQPGKEPGGKAGEGALGKPQDANSRNGSATAGTGSAEGAIDDSEEANLDYKKQASELVLKRLQEGLERGDVDPELLKQLGWTEDEMRKFTERLQKHLNEAKSSDDSPESQARRQQFDEMLKSMDLKKRGVNRSGEKPPARDVDQVESRRSSVPKEYKNAYESFTKELNRQKPASKRPSK